MAEREHKYDFFICHASEDKQIFAKPLAEELANRGYNVWYDEFSIKLGGSLVQGMSTGIRQSQYAIIVLSKNFFRKQWALKELNAFLNLETTKETDIIIPIWLEISANDILEHTPFLIDKLAIQANRSDINAVIDKIEHQTDIAITKREQIQEIINYLKTCNEDRRNKYLFDLKKRLRSIFLYQREYYNWYTSRSDL